MANFTEQLIRRRRARQYIKDAMKDPETRQELIEELLKEPLAQKEVNRQLQGAFQEAQRRFFDKELVCLVFSFFTVINLSPRTVRRWILGYRKMMEEFGTRYCTDVESDEFPDVIKSWFRTHDIDYEELTK